MIPSFEANLKTTLPVGHRYWTPRPSDISEDGFGCFRDTWPMGRWRISDARLLVDTEQQLVALADELSDNADAYEQVASALEHNDVDELPDHLRAGSAWERIHQHLYDGDPPPLEGLELGVAGLVVALAATGGCFPAASCRAHGEQSWSPYPVVLAAIDEFRAARLVDLVTETGCGFGVDEARPELLVIGAPSVRPMMSLAREILDNAAKLRRPRHHQPSSTSGQAQQSFDLGSDEC